MVKSWFGCLSDFVFYFSKDRRHVRWDPNVPWDPVAARQKYTPGDFELEKLTIDDLLVTVYQPYGFRPYPVSIFSAELNQFRKQW